MRTDLDQHCDALLRYQETVARLRSLTDDQFAEIDPGVPSPMLSANVVRLRLGEAASSTSTVIEPS